MGKYSDVAENFLSGGVESGQTNGKYSSVADEFVGGKKTPQISQEENEHMTWMGALESAVKNTPESAAKYGKDIVTSLWQIGRHPVDSGKAIGEMMQGAAQVIMPIAAQEGQTPESVQQEGWEKLKPLTDDLKTRYGTIDRFKHSVAENPVGVFSDVLSVLAPAVKGLGLSKTASTITKLEPVSMATRAAALPFKLIPEKIPIGLYKSAVKFGTTLSDKERTAVTKTALKAANQIMPTEKGLLKLRDKIDNYNAQITEKINNAVNSGTKLSASKLFAGLEDLKNQFKITSDQPMMWDKAFKDLRKNWEETLRVDSVRTPAEIQKIKQNIYKDLQSFYEKHKSTPAKVELRKVVARNAKEMLEEIIPEIKQLNKTEGELISLYDAIESKANRISNRDLIGIGLPVKMGTGSGVGYMFGGEMGGKVGSVLGFGLGIFDTPQIKAKIALVLNKLKERGIVVKPRTSALALGLYQMDKIFPETEK